MDECRSDAWCPIKRDWPHVLQEFVRKARERHNVNTVWERGNALILARVTHAGQKP